MDQLDLFAWKPAPRATPPPAPTKPAPIRDCVKDCGRADVCALYAPTGVCCPDDVCDLEAGIRGFPEPEPVLEGPIEPAHVWAARNCWAETKKPLRDYQDAARLAVHEHFESEPRGLVVAATGAGKTVLFSAIGADVVQAGGRVLILTDQFDLVDQAVDKLLAVAGIYADVEQGDRTASPKAKVVVATVQTLGNRIEKYPRDHFALVVADECDRAVAPMWQKVLEHFHDHARVLGVTATPNRADRKPILRYFHQKVFEVTLLELIERGFLADLTVREMPLSIDLREAEQEGAEDYDPAKVAHAVEAIFGDVVEALKVEAAGRKILVFLPDVETSKKFALECVKRGLNARHVDATSRDREAIKRGFAEWRPDGQHSHNAFQVLCNPMVLSRGYDEPSVDCVVNLRPTKSVALYCQIVGRGTRLFCPWGCGGPCLHEERKRDLLVLDFLYQFKGMGPVRPSALLTDSPEKAAEMQRILGAAQGALDLREVLEQATANMEAALLKAFAEAAEKRGNGKLGEYFNAATWAANLHLPELADYQPETDAEAAPVPERVQNKLRKAGFVPESVVCIGQANRLLAAVEARKEAGLASPKQVFWLRKWGYKDPWKISAKRAKSICFQEFQRAGKC